MAPDDDHFTLPGYGRTPGLLPPEHADSPADPWIGRLVAGRFRVESFVAAGGIGRVYRARQEGLERVVALKVLHPHLAHEEREKRRFHQEARVASRLRHPSAVVIHDFGEWEGSLYIAMEFLEGRTLADILDAEFPLDPARIARLLVPVCEVLGEAHEAGIVHRDVKPSNLIVVKDPDGSERTKVVDFGLLRLLKRGDDELGLTPADLVAGTPAYMSPEQCRGVALDGRSDVYALGVVLYEMLCNTVPFRSVTGMDAMLQHLYNVPEPPSRRNADVRVLPALEELALAALAKDPADRPPTALAFRDRMLRAVDPAAPKEAPASAREQRDGQQRARSDRADAAGIVPLEEGTRLGPSARSDAVVLVVEPPGDFGASLVALLRSRGYAAASAGTLDEALELVHEARPCALLVDIRPDPMGLLDRLATAGTLPVLSDVPRVVVGPEDSLEPMSRALEAGVRDYVPQSALAGRLPRVLDLILRAWRKAHGGAP